MNNLLDSKTNKMLLISIGLALLLVTVGVAVEVITGKNVFDYIALGVGKLFGDASLSTYRNAKVDGPVRQEYARLDVAKQAKEADLDIASVLQTWRPDQGDKS